MGFLLKFFPSPQKQKSDMENYFSPPGDAVLSVLSPCPPPLTDNSSGLDLNTIRPPWLTRKANVLYDYDTADTNELSLLADEVCVSLLLRLGIFKLVGVVSCHFVQSSCFFGNKDNLGADNRFPVPCSMYVCSKRYTSKNEWLKKQANRLIIK